MRRGRWWSLGVVLLGLGTVPVWGQQAPPAPQAPSERRQKDLQYTQMEYQRCRADLLELWVKGEVFEQRAKELDEALRKATEELTTLRAHSREEKPVP